MTRRIVCRSVLRRHAGHCSRMLMLARAIVADSPRAARSHIIAQHRRRVKAALRGLQRRQGGRICYVRHLATVLQSRLGQRWLTMQTPAGLQTMC